MTPAESHPKESEDALQPLSPEVVRVLVSHHRRFKDFLTRRVGQADLAEDIFQDSVKKALERPPAALREESVVAWFYHVLRSTLADHFRAHAVHQRKHDAWGREQGAGGTAADWEELEADICACFRDVLPSLRPGYAELLLRVDLNREPLERAAQALGITVNNAGVRLHRARQAMRVNLERTCGTCTEHGCLNCRCSAAQRPPLPKS